MLVITFLLSINILISFGMCSTPKLSKYIILSRFGYNAIQGIPTDSYASRFTTYATSFVLVKLSLE